MHDQALPAQASVSWLHSLRPLAGITLLSLLLALLGRAVMPWQAMFPDIICFWTAGTLLASGQSPYDPDLQTLIHKEFGWDRELHGVGLYDFLPYYYPPWLGLLWMGLLPLGYPWARAAWYFLNVEMVVAAGYLLGSETTRLRWLFTLLAPAFYFSLACIAIGQSSILSLFLTVLAWKLLDRGNDLAAGAVLAWVTFKPQLGAVLFVGVLLWAIRQHRRRVVWGCAAMLGILAAVSTAISPGWPVGMVELLLQTPKPTDYYPWIGNTWYLVLKALGLRGGWLWAFYLAAALPFLGALVWLALDRATRVADLLALSILAIFFVVPYARHYDFPVLLVPLLVLVRDRLGPWPRRTLLAALLCLPYVQLPLLADLKGAYQPSVKFLLESTYFWVPSLLTLLWLVSGARQRGQAVRSSIIPQA
jgi:hypothetical protein